MEDNVKPVVGMGATILFYSDRKAATVTAVSKTGKTATLQLDHAERIDGNGLSEQAQKYTYTPDPNGETWKIYLNSRGDWKTYGDARNIWLGVRVQHEDPSF